jgi:signal transduction histidine kinase
VDLEALRAAERRWRALNPPDVTLPLSSAVRDRRAISGRQVIDASERLHQDFVALSELGGEEVRRLEQIDMVVSAGLASIALAAMAIVVALERKVRRFAAEADDRARKLERSIELRATLINGVVHDVKNPLGAAAGYADLLTEGVAGPMNERQTEMVGRFKRLIETAQQTVAELVDLARVEAKEYTIERRDTNLVAALRRIVDDHQPEAARKSMTLSFSPPADSLWLKTDANRLRHVIENLLSNALKYTPAGGVINVALKVDDGAPPHARITVRDNGPGVPIELRERIFDPFYRIPSSEHRVPGSGLGLAISRRIAGLLGGDLMVTDAPGGGSDFVLTLPMEKRSSTDLPGEMVPS